MASRRSTSPPVVKGGRLRQLWLSFPMLIVPSLRKLAQLADHYRSLLSAIARAGLSVPLSSAVLRRRRDLGLPEVAFGAEEARELVEALSTRGGEGSK
ncbi:MAG: hypothetical protein QXT74_02040 [Candidatus Nezhaarchaeales archaeon]